MSFHVITLLQPGARLSVDRGFLVCQYADGTENRLALADVRAIVVGTPAISFSNACLARLLAQDALLLHCDKQYKPIGWTVSLDRVIRAEVFDNQTQRKALYEKTLWKAIVHQKMANQASVLNAFDIEHTLDKLINKPLASEANVSRQYWGHYFSLLGGKQRREHQNADSFENKALNYGYAVISTLIHRAILIYGLQPALGIHHKFRYRSYPLVYDLMEPFRPFVDLFLAQWQAAFLRGPKGEEDSDLSEQDFQHWIRHLMNAMQTCRIKKPGEIHSHKLMDAIDTQVKSVAACFETTYFKSGNIERLWLPTLEDHYWRQLPETEEGTTDDQKQI